jgi:hypothetical protein
MALVLLMAAVGRKAVAHTSADRAVGAVADRAVGAAADSIAPPAVLDKED